MLAELIKNFRDDVKSTEFKELKNHSKGIQALLSINEHICFTFMHESIGFQYYSLDRKEIKFSICYNLIDDKMIITHIIKVRENDNDTNDVMVLFIDNWSTITSEESIFQMNTVTAMDIDIDDFNMVIDLNAAITEVLKTPGLTDTYSTVKLCTS